jgi:hypothetical protein
MCVTPLDSGQIYGNRVFARLFWADERLALGVAMSTSGQRAAECAHNLSRLWVVDVNRSGEYLAWVRYGTLLAYCRRWGALCCLVRG